MSSPRPAKALCCSAKSFPPPASTAWSITAISISNGEAMKRRVAILISGRGSNMTALVEAARARDFPAEIVVVISNRADAAGLAKARDSGIATVTIESKSFGKQRAGFEAELQSALDDYRVDLICLGGFMRLFTAVFVQR